MINAVQTQKSLNVYPRWLMDEAARDLGYKFVRTLPGVAADAAPRPG
jgi:hypothetical protein